MYGIIGGKQKEAFKAMFHEVDKDKNGSVTLEELKLKMMPAVTKDDINNFVQVCYSLHRPHNYNHSMYTIYQPRANFSWWRISLSIKPSDERGRSEPPSLSLLEVLLHS